MIKDADGNVQTLDFPPGQNIAATWTPTDPGTYAVDIVVAGLATDGSAIERTAFLAVEVQTNPATFQITLNFVALIVGLLLVLFLRALLRGAGKVIRRA